MAVSRGGGFSHGGGGSYSSRGGGGSSGGKGPTFSTRPFAGAHLYMYLNRHGQKRQFYSNKPPAQRGYVFPIIASVIGFICLVVFSVLIFTSCLPSRLPEGYCQPSGDYLTDNAGLIENVDKFNLSMKSFYDKTGIEPHLYTMLEDDFPTETYGEFNTDALQEFIYYEYYNIINDEGHYLIAIVKHGDGEYTWCEMAGNDTIGLIDDEAFGNMQVNMLALTRDCKVGEVVSDCFDKLAEDAFTVTSNDKFSMAMIAVFDVLMLAFIVIALITSIKQTRMTNDYLYYQQKKNDFPFNQFANQ